MPAWAVALAVLLLGPVLGPGYLLTYDMVWVPDLALRSDFWGLAPGLPRSVPSDAVVAVLDEVLPGMVLQKLVLLGSLLGAGLGCARLAGPGPVARMTAVAVAIWNPFVVERLWLGHWTLLVGYGVLPWLVHGAVRAREEQRVPWWLLVLLPLGSLSASAGVVSAVAVLALGMCWAAPVRTRAGLGAAVLAANAPWVVAGLLHASVADIGPSTRLFALHGDGLPAPITALSLGGVWNAEVVPATRTAVVLPAVATALVVLVALVGTRPLLRRVGRRTAAGLAGCWAVGYALAVLTWTAPGAVDAVAGAVPGGGLLRDGGRWLALCVPLLAALAGDAAAAGYAAFRARAADARAHLVLAAVAVLAPLALLPDAAWGVAGELRPADYPQDWTAARDAVADLGAAGDLLVLPLGAYRAPPWNRHATVLDPLGRYLPADFVADDELIVSGRTVPGEDPRLPEVRHALGLEPDDAAGALRSLGIEVVALEKDAPTGSSATLPSGTTVFDGPTLRVVRLPGEVDERSTGPARKGALALAWASYAALLLLGAVIGAVRVAANGPRRGRG